MVRAFYSIDNNKMDLDKSDFKKYYNFLQRMIRNFLNFCAVDKNIDRRIMIAEFLNCSKSCNVKDPESEYNNLTKKGAGHIT